MLSTRILDDRGKGGQPFDDSATPLHDLLLNRRQPAGMKIKRTTDGCFKGGREALLVPLVCLSPLLIRLCEGLGPQCRLPLDELLDCLNQQLVMAAGHFDELAAFSLDPLEPMGQLAIDKAVHMFEDALFAALDD